MGDGRVAEGDQELFKYHSFISPSELLWGEYFGDLGEAQDIF